MLCKFATAVPTATCGRLKKFVLHSDWNCTHILTSLHTIQGLEDFKLTQDHHGWARRPRGDKTFRRGPRNQHTCHPNCHRLPSILPTFPKNSPDISILTMAAWEMGMAQKITSHLISTKFTLLAWRGCLFRHSPMTHDFPPPRPSEEFMSLIHTKSLLRIRPEFAVGITERLGPSSCL